MISRFWGLFLQFWNLYYNTFKNSSGTKLVIFQTCFHLTYLEHFPMSFHLLNTNILLWKCVQPAVSYWVELLTMDKRWSTYSIPIHLSSHNGQHFAIFSSQSQAHWLSLSTSYIHFLKRQKHFLTQIPLSHLTVNMFLSIFKFPSVTKVFLHFESNKGYSTYLFAVFSVCFKNLEQSPHPLSLVMLLIRWISCPIECTAFWIWLIASLVLLVLPSFPFPSSILSFYFLYSVYWAKALFSFGK